MKVKVERNIDIIGDINEEAFAAFSKRLFALECASPGPVDILLNSGGGTATDALAFYARMRLSRCKLRVTVYGTASSAATLILVAGDYRRMTKEAWVMVHEDSGKISGTVVDMEREAAQHRRLEDQWNVLMSERTTTIEEDWEQMNKTTRYLDPQECLELGLIDEVI